MYIYLFLVKKSNIFQYKTQILAFITLNSINIMLDIIIKKKYPSSLIFIIFLLHYFNSAKYSCSLSFSPC